MPLSDFPILIHPMDKTDNYIKRCVGVPGDVIEVRDGILYVNDEKAFVAPYAQTEYKVTFKNGGFSPKSFLRR